METALVQAAIRSGTGDQDFTSTGFGTPQLAIFFLSKGSVNGTTVTHAHQTYGATDGTNQFCASVRSQGGGGGRNGSSSILSDSYCIAVLGDTYGSGLVSSASFNSWITDGVRVTWDAAGWTPGQLVQCLLINDLTNASVHTLALDGDNDAETVVSGLGFEPENLIVLGTNQQTLNTEQSDWNYSIGFVRGGATPEQASHFSFTEYYATVMNEHESVSSAYGAHFRDLNGLIVLDVEFDSFGADGYSAFARNSAYSSTTHYFGIIALEHGLDSNVGIWSGPGEGFTGDHSLQFLRCTPQLGMVVSSGVLTADTEDSDFQGGLCVSVFDSTGEYSAASVISDGSGNAYEFSCQDAKALHLIETWLGLGDWTIANLKSFDQGGWTFTYTHNQILYNDMVKMPYLAIGAHYDNPNYGTDPFNIEVVVDIIDLGLRPGYLPGFGIEDFERSQFHIYTDDRDGSTVTYTQEIIATNTDTSDHEIVLHDGSVYSGWYSAINIPAGTTSPKLFTATFTPTTDYTGTYRWYVPMVGSYRSAVTLYKGSYRATQAGCTNTVIYRPLADYHDGSAEHYYQQFDSSFLSHSQTDYVAVPFAGSFIYDPLLHTAEKDTVAIEVNFSSSLHSGTIGFCLWDETDGALVAGTEFSEVGRSVLGSPNSSYKLFSFDVSLLTSGHIYRLYWKSISLDNTSIGKFYGARMYYKLRGCTKATVYYRIAKTISGPAGDVALTSRTQINLQDPGATFITGFTETCARQVYGSCDYWMLYDGNNLDGNASSATTVPGTDIRFNYPPLYSFHYPRFSDPLDESIFTDGSMYLGSVDPVTDGANGLAIWVLAAITWIPPTLEPPEPEVPSVPDENNPDSYNNATLVWAKDLMADRHGWFLDLYNPAIFVHYGDEGDGVNGTLLGGSDGGVYLLSGQSDNGTAIDCRVVSMSRDQGDPRYQKLYDDVLVDLDTNGVAVDVVPRFNNLSLSADTTTVNNSARTKVPIGVGVRGREARNVAVDFSWSSASAKPYLYAWEPRFTEVTAKVSAYSWETSWLTHMLPGFFYHGWLYLVHKSSVDLTFEIINPDSTAAASVTVANSGADLYAKTFVRLPVVKGKVYKYKLSCSTEFFVNGDKSELLVKPWGHGGPWRHEKIFQDIPMGSAA